MTKCSIWWEKKQSKSPNRESWIHFFIPCGQVTSSFLLLNNCVQSYYIIYATISGEILSSPFWKTSTFSKILQKFSTPPHPLFYKSFFSHLSTNSKIFLFFFFFQFLNFFCPSFFLNFIVAKNNQLPKSPPSPLPLKLPFFTFASLSPSTEHTKV